MEGDSTGLPSNFIECLRDQDTADVQGSYPKLEAAIRRAALEFAKTKIVTVRVPETDCFVGSELYLLLSGLPLIAQSDVCPRLPCVPFLTS